MERDDDQKKGSSLATLGVAGAIVGVLAGAGLAIYSYYSNKPQVQHTGHTTQPPRSAERRMSTTNTVPSRPTSPCSTTSDSSGWSNNSDSCPICFREVPSDIGSRAVLPCNHFYHARCIREWHLQKKNTCPMCREPFDL